MVPYAGLLAAAFLMPSALVVPDDSSRFIHTQPTTLAGRGISAVGMRGEVLSAFGSINLRCAGGNGYYDSAYGAARGGPYPGTWAASGQYIVDPSGTYLVGFYEYFDIWSGSYHLSGYITLFPTSPTFPPSTEPAQCAYDGPEYVGPGYFFYSVVIRKGSERLGALTGTVWLRGILYNGVTMEETFTQ